MKENNKKSDDKKDKYEVDPLDELNKMEETYTIETEKDFFEELDNEYTEKLPEYDSKKGKIVEDTEDSKAEDDVIPKLDLMEEIDKVSVSNANESKSQNKESTGKQSEKEKTVKSKTLSNKKKDESTKVIDNVKVDDEGVPLLNQFDMEKIKDSSMFPKVTVRKVNLSKIIMIVIGVIIALIGVYYAINDVVKISDHVMYGEHESLAIGLIFLGFIFIILAFYKEIMKAFGLSNISSSLDEGESSMPKSRKTNEKKEK